MADAVRPEYQNQSNGMLQRASAQENIEALVEAGYEVIHVQTDVACR